MNRGATLAAAAVVVFLGGGHGVLHAQEEQHWEIGAFNQWAPSACESLEGIVYGSLGSARSAAEGCIEENRTTMPGWFEEEGWQGPWYDNRPGDDTDFDGRRPYAYNSSGGWGGDTVEAGYNLDATQDDVTDPNQCSWAEGDVMFFIGGNQSPGQVFGSGGCEYKVTWSFGDLGDGTGLRAEGTGEPYEGSDEEIPQPDDNCIAGEGRELCLDDVDESKGQYGDTEYDLEPGDEGGCIKGGGETICLQDDNGNWPEEAPTTDFGGEKPPADEWFQPDGSGDGTDGGDGNGDGPGQWLGGWPEGTGDGEGDGPGDGDGEGDEFPDEMGIDEEGVPEGEDDMFAQEYEDTGADDLVDDLENMGDLDTAPESDFSTDDFPLPESGSCQTVTMQWGERTYTIPNDAGCNAMERLKAIFGWVLYIYTAWSIFEITTRKPGG